MENPWIYMSMILVRFISAEKYIDRWQSVIRTEWSRGFGNLPFLQGNSLLFGF